MKRSVSESGQVLILGVAILLLLTMAVLMLFDVHTMVRAKIKVESAQQASALAGAKWQREALNLIGQINLVKATVLMTEENSQIPSWQETPDPEKQFQQAQWAFQSRIQPLTELQSRISFVLPMLGVFAVQQTAKQNHLPANRTELFRYYLNRTLALNDRRYSQLQGYYWFEPYQKLMAQIVAQGCALRVNARIDEMPEVWSNPEGSKGDNTFRLLLSDPALYDAIQQENYCYWQLRDMAKRGVTLQDPWWRIFYREAPFVQESELLPLGVSYASVLREQLPQLSDRFSNYTPPAPLADSTQFPSVPWCIYDTFWYPESFSSTAYQAQQSNWRYTRFLRANRKEAYLYEGPVSAVDGYVEADQLNRIHPRAATEAFGLGKNAATAMVRNTRKQSKIIGFRGNQQAELRGVSAKVLGAFHNAASAEDSPISVPVILPIFDKISLIPSTMPYRLSMLTEGPDDLKRFLQWLARTENVYESVPPANTERYWQLLQHLTREEYMKSIYNPDFVGLESISPREIFDGTYQYPREPYGAGKLQHAYIGKTWVTPVKQEFVKNDKDGNPIYKTVKLVEDNVITSVTEIREEADGAIRTYLGTEKNGYRYFLTKNGKILTYEDIACGSARRQPGSDGHAGSNMGPPRL